MLVFLGLTDSFANISLYSKYLFETPQEAEA